MTDFVPSNAKRVLDVGCGAGLFGAQLKARGAEVWGIELVSEAAKLAATRLDKVVNQDVASALPALPEAHFDCVVFNDILEHLVDPYSALTLSKRLLTREGTVVASIPNVRHYHNIWNLLVRRQWRYEEAGILDRTHLRFFTEKSILEMFEGLGFDIVQMRGINSHTPRKLKWVAPLSLGFLADLFHPQFACVVVPRQRNTPAEHAYRPLAVG